MIKKFKRISKIFLTLILSFLLVYSLQNQVFAQNQESTENIKNLTDNITMSESEKILKTYNNQELNDIYEKSKNLLESFNLSKKDLLKIQLIENINNNREFYRVTADNAIIEFDTNYELINLTNFSNTDFSKKSKQTIELQSENRTLKNMTYLNKKKVINCKDDLSNIIFKIEKVLNIPKDYELVLNEQFDDDFGNLFGKRNFPITC